MTTLPLVFSVPTTAYIDRLRELLNEQDVVDKTDLARYMADKDQEGGEICGLKDLMSRLSNWLSADFEENSSDPNVPWTFEYVADKEGYQDGGITVMTRLRSFDASQGVICYGSLFYRVGADEYLCWFGQ